MANSKEIPAFDDEIVIQAMKNMASLARLTGTNHVPVSHDGERLVKLGR